MPPTAAYWVLVAIFFAAMTLITAATPLYGLWEIRDNFSTAVGTIVFSMSSVGVLISLVFAANLSNKLGRRTTMFVGLAILVVACVMFVAPLELPAILIARFLSGVGVGIVIATAPTYLAELRRISKPDADPKRGGAIVSYITMGGFAFGALLTVGFVVFASRALILPFVVLGIIFVVSILVLVFVQETTPLEMRSRPFHAQRISFPSKNRATFVAAAAGGFCSFAVLGFFGALAPALVADVTGLSGKAESEVGGLVAFSIFVSAAIGQIGFVRVAARAKIMMTIIFTCAGLLCIGVSVVVPNLPGVLLGGILAGLGAGLIFLVSVSTVSALTNPEQRGASISTIYFAAYLGMPIPVIGTGIGLMTLGPLITVPIFGAAIFACVLWCCLHMLHTLKKSAQA